MMAVANFSSTAASRNPKLVTFRCLAATLVVAALVLSGELPALLACTVVLLSVVVRRTLAARWTPTPGPPRGTGVIEGFAANEGVVHNVSKNTTTQELQDVGSAASTWRLIPHESDSTNKWEGPESSTIIKLDQVSVFVTTQNGITLPPDISYALLFCAHGSPTETGINTGSTDLKLEWLIGDNDAPFLVAKYGKDSVAVEYDDPGMTPRTHYVIRTEEKLVVGFFDAVTRRERKEGKGISVAIRPDDTRAISVNSSGQAIKPRSLLIYNSDVTDHITDVKNFIAEDVLRDNSVVKEKNSKIRELQTQVTSPRFKGVEDACSSVTNWARFDAVQVSTACRTAIRTSCEADKTQSGCECWDEDRAIHSTPECDARRTMYGVKSAGDNDGAVDRGSDKGSDSHGVQPSRPNALKVNPALAPINVAYARQPGWLAFMIPKM